MQDDDESPVRRLFSSHVHGLIQRRDLRRERLRLKPITTEAAAETAGAAGSGGADVPEFEGDRVLERLQGLLADIDRRGYARSAHQLQFHDAFIRACGRVIYRQEWGTSRPVIMQKNKWAKSPSEILISTPRRFGKTFSYELEFYPVRTPSPLFPALPRSS